MKAVHMDTLLDLFRSDMDTLQRGVMMYSEAYDRQFLVVGVPYLVAGDSPARAAILGFKAPTPKTIKPCSFCHVTSATLNALPSEENAHLGLLLYERRTSEEIKEFWQRLDPSYREDLREYLKKSAGLSRESPLLKTSFDVTTDVGIELMHLMLEGQVQKHMRKFSKTLETLMKRVAMLFTEVSLEMRTILKINDLDDSAKFSDLNHWFGSTTANAKLKFTILSPILLRRLPAHPELELWKDHVLLLVRLMSLQFSPNDLTELRKDIAVFQLKYRGVYGQESLNGINAHLLSHVVEHILRFGSLKNCWTFSTESVIKGLKDVATNYLSLPSDLHHHLLRKVWLRIIIEVTCKKNLVNENSHAYGFDRDGWYTTPRLAPNMMASSGSDLGFITAINTASRSITIRLVSIQFYLAGSHYPVAKPRANEQIVAISMENAHYHYSYFDRDLIYTFPVEI